MPHASRTILILAVSLWIMTSGWIPSSQADGDLWLQHRHDNHNTGRSESTIADYYEVNWSVEMDDPVQAAPVMDLDRIYIYPTGSKTLYALNKNDGSINWNYQSNRANAPSSGWKPAGATVSGNHVFIGMDDGFMYCLDKNTGDMIWEYETGYDISAAPVVQDGAVYFGTNGGEFYSLDIDTGDLIWVFDECGSVHSTAAIADGIVYFGSLDGYVYAVDQEGNGDDPNPLNRQTTNLVWSFETDGEIYSSPAIAGNRLFIGSNDNRLYALNKDTSDKFWEFEDDDNIESSVALFGSDLILLTEFYAYRITQESGDTIWSFEPDRALYGSPSVVDGRTIFGDRTGNAYILSAENGELLFKTYMSSGNGSSGSVTSTPAIVDGCLCFTTSRNFVFYLSPATPPNQDTDDDSELSLPPGFVMVPIAIAVASGLSLYSRRPKKTIKMPVYSICL